MRHNMLAAIVHVYVPWYGTRVPLVLASYHGRVRTYDRPKGGDAGAGARAGPHACEDCGGDPRCSRVGTSTVVYRDVFYADNAHYHSLVLE